MFRAFALRDSGVGFEELAIGLFLHITIVVLDQQIDIKLIPSLTNLAVSSACASAGLFCYIFTYLSRIALISDTKADSKEL